MSDTVTLTKDTLEKWMLRLEDAQIPHAHSKVESVIRQIAAALAAPQTEALPKCAACRTPNSCSGDGLCLEKYIASRLEAQPAPQPCDAGELCLDCQPRVCPDAQPVKQAGVVRPNIPDLLAEWERRSKDALPADAMLINKHIRELRESIEGAKP